MSVKLLCLWDFCLIEGWYGIKIVFCLLRLILLGEGKILLWFFVVSFFGFYIVNEDEYGYINR